jgi:hypothetical protein
MAPAGVYIMQGLSGRGYADLCIFMQHHNM